MDRGVSPEGIGQVERGYGSHQMTGKALLAGLAWLYTICCVIVVTCYLLGQVFH